jgi:ribulose-phosphate 3-epimerase
LSSIDLLLVMTVFPGFGGQSFMAEVLPKIEEAHRAITERGLSVSIEVDGGIDKVTAAPCARAGARIFVAGSAVFGAERPWEAVEEIRASIVGTLDARPSDGRSARPARPS